MYVRIQVRDKAGNDGYAVAYIKLEQTQSFSDASAKRRRPQRFCEASSPATLLRSVVARNTSAKRR
jgi:hypothetical protein